MDGENNGKPYLYKWMIWGENPLFSETSISSPRSLSKEFLEIKKLFGQDLLEGGQVTWDKTCRFFQRREKKQTTLGWSQERSAM